MATHKFSFYQTVRVFLGCPNDLTSERSRFPRLLETVNNLRAHSLGFHLEAVGWERIIPSIGRPQAIINKELLTADLVVIMFWNRIGSPSAIGSDITGTVEEYRLARAGKDENGVQRPGDSTWLYFRRPTVLDGDQYEQVHNFRKELEAGKDILFWDYDEISDWEEMFRQHLVAFLDGLERRDIEGALKLLRPTNPLLMGRFQSEAIYEVGTVLDIKVDLDGCGNDETVRFKFSQFNFSLVVVKFDKGFHLDWSSDFEEFLNASSIQHIAVRDVTNDGLPEIIVAAHSRDDYLLKVGVFGFSNETRETRDLSKTNFTQIGELDGQHLAYVLEGGVFMCPYGSVGLSSTYAWSDGNFKKGEDYSPQKRYSAL